MSERDPRTLIGPKGLSACAHWLVYCLSIGWQRDQLDMLEALWWKYHDRNGNLLDAASATVVRRREG